MVVAPKRRVRADQLAVVGECEVEINGVFMALLRITELSGEKIRLHFLNGFSDFFNFEVVHIRDRKSLGEFGNHV